MKAVILACYLVALINYCVFILADKDEPRITRLNFIIACFPPTACVLGVLGLILLPNESLVAKFYSVAWLAGIAGCVWDGLDHKRKSNCSWFLIIYAGVLPMAFVFGPGLYFGYVWIRMNV